MDFFLPTRPLTHRFGISLGGDEKTYRVVEFTVQETLSSPYRVSVRLASRQPNLDPDTVLGQTAILTVQDEGSTGGEPRPFHGIVTAFSQQTPTSNGITGHSLYAVEIAPRLALLQHTSDCRIFQQVTVRQIVEEILRENRIDDFRWNLERNPAPREFCCQYQETDFDFIHRLLAEEGVWYTFEHTKENHVLVFTDMNSGGVKGPESILYNGASGGDAPLSSVSNFVFQKALGSGQAVQRDYTFRHPRYSLESQFSDSSESSDLDRELYFFPGRYKKNDPGKDYTRLWLESMRAGLAVGAGSSNILGLTAGCVTALQDYRDGLDGKYLMVRVSHQGSQPQVLEEEAGEGGTTYSNSFECIPGLVPFRPPRQHKPHIDGPQMATVVGPKGEEIFTDEFGRAKVQFAWDRYGKSDDKSSCWIRIAQNWAGLRFGHVALPRVGDEVLVGFLEGDVDQPIILGRAYNALNMPPYKLPENKTKMVIQSKSHRGNGFNEMSFEDEKDNENMYFHAQKDQTTVVLNDQSGTVGRYKKMVVGDEYVIQVGLSKIVIDKEGNITITGKNFNFSATDHVQINGKVVDVN